MSRAGLLVDWHALAKARALPLGRFDAIWWTSSYILNIGCILASSLLRDVKDKIRNLRNKLVRWSCGWQARATNTVSNGNNFQAVCLSRKLVRVKFWLSILLVSGYSYGVLWASMVFLWFQASLVDKWTTWKICSSGRFLWHGNRSWPLMWCLVGQRQSYVIHCSFCTSFLFVQRSTIMCIWYSFNYVM